MARAPKDSALRDGEASLFDLARERTLAAKAPLAARMRPRTLEEFEGQPNILGPGRLLRRAIQADQLSSLIFYGPPGTGKTTLARIIANTTRAHFTALNAVLSGVADLRAAVAEAEARLGQHGTRTILFVDEVHRFNKAQQDALLPHVENGTVVLIGATTENPYFEVNKALVSRSRIFELRPLTEGNLAELLLRAMRDAERGYGKVRARIEPEALAHLTHVANGDARAALNALELAMETTPPGPDGEIVITLAVAEESIQRKAVLYDKDGDAHFDTVSAFIKSLRGSDPDAALYWMARMVYAGEDPRFIFRRMIVFAAEDVGLADPEALRVVMSAAQAFDYVGMPEGRFHLAEACLYLATAPKSNSAFAFFDALAAVEQERAEAVPDPLKDANRDQEGFGHGEGYLYPHAYRDHWVAQQYLPDSLKGRVFYDPSLMGREAAVRERVARLREAQLEALSEAQRLGRSLYDGAAGSTREGSSSPADTMDAAEPAHGSRAEWSLRSEGAVTRHLERVREAVFDLAKLERQSLVLDANAGGGMLVWEALRLSPQGGVWARVDTEAQARALQQQAERMAAQGRPVAFAGPAEALERRVAEVWAQSGGGEEEHVRFDRVLARGLLGGEGGQPVGLLCGLAAVLANAGWLVLAETLPGGSERFFSTLAQVAQSRGVLSGELARRLSDAETALFAETGAAWDERQLEAWCRAAGLEVRGRRLLVSPVDVTITPELVARWFGTAERPRRTLAGGADSSVRGADNTAEPAAQPAEPPSAGATPENSSAARPKQGSGEAQTARASGAHSMAPGGNPAPRSRLAEHLGDASVEIARRMTGLARHTVRRNTAVAVLRLERAAAPAKEAHG
ncbi:MAG: AAA family ATPase [SAR324 cluster bacterium]